MIDDVIHPSNGAADLMLEAIAVRCCRSDVAVDFALTVRGAGARRNIRGRFDASGREWPVADKAAEREIGVVGARRADRQREDQRKAANVSQRRHGRSR